MDADIKLNADKASLVREILNIEDKDIFNKLKQAVMQILKQESTKDVIYGS